MKKDEVLATLKEAEPALRARGVMHAALFGSVARGDAGPASDLDIMVEIAPEIEPTIGVYEYLGIVHAIEDLFAVRVDVLDRKQLKAAVRPSAERDALYAF